MLLGEALETSCREVSRLSGPQWGSGREEGWGAQEWGGSSADRGPQEAWLSFARASQFPEVASSIGKLKGKRKESGEELGDWD